MPSFTRTRLEYLARHSSSACVTELCQAQTSTPYSPQGNFIGQMKQISSADQQAGLAVNLTTNLLVKGLCYKCNPATHGAMTDKNTCAKSNLPALLNLIP